MHLYSELSETRRCSISIQFKLFFRLCHQEFQENQEALKWSGTHQLLVYAEDFNILVEKINIIKKQRSFLRG
jgi:hypothetical protein